MTAASAVTTSGAPNLGIPEAEFLEDVDDFMKRPENDSVGAEAIIKRFDELHSKYKFMEQNLMTKKARLKTQIPDISASLDVVKHMKNREEDAWPMKTHFQMSDQVYCKAEIPPTDKVSLWLGANVMLEYSIDDAESLLSKNLDAANATLEQTEENLGYLRDQTTTLEVNMARVYNWDVKRRQAEKAAT